MKLFLFAIIAFHLANFGEAQISIIPNLIGLPTCGCANLWIEGTEYIFGLPVGVNAGKLAKLIILSQKNSRHNVGCFDSWNLKTMLSVLKVLKYGYSIKNDPCGWTHGFGFLTLFNFLDQNKDGCATKEEMEKAIKNIRNKC
jgi:hypothetical protein